MKLINKHEAAALLRISLSTFDRMVYRAEIPPPYIFPSGTIRFSLDELFSWLETRKAPK